MYFDKSAKDVTLEEAATLAAIIQTPARLSPFVNPERTLARRNNYVLPRMADEGFITQRGGRRGRGSDRSSLRGQPDAGSVDRARTSSKTSARSSSRSTAPTRCIRAGLRVQTTLDVDLQEAANRRARSRPAPARQAAATASADRPATSSPKAARSRRSRPIAGRSRSSPATSSRPWSRSCPARPAAARASASASTRLELTPTAFAWTRTHVGGRAVQGRAT